MKKAIKLITEERKRQIEVEGWTAEHDAKHTTGQLAYAAACYALPNNVINLYAESGMFISFKRWTLFPFAKSWWKPRPTNERQERIRELTKAGALIAAEIDRLLEMKEPEALGK